MALRRLAHDVLDALLELAPVFGARDHAGKVQHEHSLASDIFRHKSHGNALRQPLHDRRLADAGFPDEAGVIFGAAAQDLHDAADLALAPDDRIKSSLRRKAGQVAAVGVDRRRRPGGAPHGAAAEEILLVEHAFHAHRDDRIPVHSADIDPHRVQEPCRDAVGIAEQGQQDVLGPDFRGAEGACQHLALREYIFRTRRKAALLLREDRVPGGDQLLDQLGKLFRRDPRI